MMEYLNESSVEAFIKAALAEDIGDGDHSTLASVPEDAIGKAKLLVKDDGIIAGIEMAKQIFDYFDPELKVETLIGDGARVKQGEIAFTVEGKARSILTSERLVLNCMQRMSGIATYTSNLNDLISHTNAKLLDTRKTTPNFRICEKWAVVIGGGKNHRFGLYDMVMLKDNHIDFAGGIHEAISATKNYLHKKGLDLKIEVETRNLDEVKQVLDHEGIYSILLDNMGPEILKEAVELINGRTVTEASGGITEETITAIAESGVDYISVGALTHSAGSLDLSLKAIDE
ncbi:carboxylating nicotinate-nucleotide diphosphorylase [Marinigracilibium pacificum]|uniref:Probable nicotinate-nucleotide pyrophosphorylase [carboxylating] n=1 Tax=Marinigracilibium pacificum TaxID=2729599 RepID=A0A848IU94_9BACT|nr:carboxylating nicotinate-nucleotide diphosphorylase [Marinigracilibium pacificum]NMM46781.1 carboxylating nicotinate-nucleotide diphosphorylase [Marinigracilibium pacificum]